MHPLAHMITGAIIGQVAPGPAAAAVGGLVSHYVLDVIPHTEGETFYGEAPIRLLRPDVIEAGAEFIAGSLIIGWLSTRCDGLHFLSVAFGALGALLPDLIDLPLKALFKAGPFLHLRRLHWTVTRKHAVFGVLTQLLVVVTAGFFLWNSAICR